VVLIVDDDGETTLALAEFLSSSGHAVLTASNGKQALRLLSNSNNKPKVIFLDLMIPELDGWGFLEAREIDPDLADVPVVVVSGSPGLAKSAKRAGAMAVLHKPVEPYSVLRIADEFEDLWIISRGNRYAASFATSSSRTCA